MATLITILKIVGIICLSILAMLGVLLIIVLFVPIRYKAVAKYKDEAYADVKISYLLHIISLSFKYEKEFEYKIKVFGIPIKLKKKSVKDKADSFNNAKDGLGKADNEADKNATEDISASNCKEKTNEAASNKNIKDKLEKVLRYVDILNLDVTRNAWDCCKKRLVKLLKHILPRKTNISIVYGITNPAYTGMIMGLYNVFYNYLATPLKLLPVYDSDENILEADAKLKGHIMIAPVLIQLIIVILNKNCREFYRLIKRESKQKTVKK